MDYAILEKHFGKLYYAVVPTLPRAITASIKVCITDLNERGFSYGFWKAFVSVINSQKSARFQNFP